MAAERRRRSIPACAGEPPTAQSWTRQTAVYPRVCGGTTLEAAVGGGVHGLSPRVRGNLPPCRTESHREGSIPACAGEPPPSAAADGAAPVYPRVCGGTVIYIGEPKDDWGLSPRVRGNPIVDLRQIPRRRSIPACAGEPGFHSAAMAGAGVYPRVCGGTEFGTDTHSVLQGLSPRVRGNPAGGGCVIAARRSIPACAGEPEAFRRRGDSAGVYPRVCGGTRHHPVPPRGFSGLSPRVRGNLTQVGAGQGALRSIPACAGEPRAVILSSPVVRVYPRVCGGTHY